MTTPQAMDIGEHSGSGSGEQSTSGEPNPRKRYLVDPDDMTKEITPTKKPNIPTNKELKIKVMLYVAKCHKEIHQSIMREDEKKMMDVQVGSQVHSINFTAYNYLRKEATGSLVPKPNDGTDFIVTYLNTKYSVKRPIVIALVRKIAAEEGLEFKKYGKHDPNNWFGICSAIMAILAFFQTRWQEVRFGHGKFAVRKDKQGVRAYSPVSLYGLESHHHVLLEGITMQPERRSAMAQSVGPMSSLIFYLRSNANSAEKWKAAAKRALAMIPNIDSILSLIKGMRADAVRQLVASIANICLITTTRQATRMSPPPNMFSSIVSNKDVAQELINNINFSGEGAFRFYKVMQDLKFEIQGNYTETEARQLVYHCTFGTYKENLSVLKAITNEANWLKRNQYGDVFQQNTTCGNKTTVSFVQQKIWPKLSSANQTGLVTEVKSQVTCVPCFSGKRTQRPFFQTVGSQRGWEVELGSLNSHVGNLVTIFRKLIEDWEKNGKRLEMGTTNWFTMDSLGSPDGNVSANVRVNRDCVMLMD